MNSSIQVWTLRKHILAELDVCVCVCTHMYAAVLEKLPAGDKLFALLPTGVPDARGSASLINQRQ